jgi:colicin import membrane protein
LKRSPKLHRNRRTDAAKVAADKKKAAQAQAEQQRQQRLAALGQMADAALEQSLERESVSLLRDEEALAAQSFRAGIYELVRKNWSRPPSARNGMSARLLVELIPTGEVIAVEVVESSGNSAFDQSAEQAVRQARRFVVPSDNAQFERYFRRFYFLFKPEDLLR